MRQTRFRWSTPSPSQPDASSLCAIAAMKFLADESFDFRLMRALQTRGHDVITVSDHAPGADDATVMRLAASQNRVLLTEDKDFGWLVYVSGLPACGVILLRCPEVKREEMQRKLAELISKHAAELSKAFVVVTPDKARFSKLPNLARG